MRFAIDIESPSAKMERMRGGGWGESLEALFCLWRPSGCRGTPNLERS